MKQNKTTILNTICGTGMALLMFTAGANAAVLTFTDTVDPGVDQLISFGNNKSYSFSHSIVADQDGAGTFWDGSYGYNPLTDTITSASIALLFKDESTDTAAESVQLIFDTQSFGVQSITSGGANYTATISSGWNTLLDDGVLNVTLENAGITSNQQSLRSDFLFLESTLTVSVDRGVQSIQQVSEPATAALMVLVLTGFVFNRWSGKRV